MKSKKIIYIFSLILVIVICWVVILGYNYFFKKDNTLIINKIITNNGLMLNETNYYVANGEQIKIDLKNPNKVKYTIVIKNKEVVSDVNNELLAINTGFSDFEIVIDNFIAFNGTIYVVKGLDIPKENFDKKKPFVSCDTFTEEENNLLDNALKSKIKIAQENTRASVVAAARFLTLDFGYRIPYFYENGRLNNYSPSAKVDGEGRYYHKGLYLNKSKYKDIQYKFTGPGSWGCKIKQFEDAPQYNFIPGGKYPNGLDCSGFISWVLYNGGFDVKDSGAGDIVSRKDDLYDLGEKNIITNQLLDSENVKVGDLIAYSGHMAIITGLDSEGNYYIAESLPQYKGVVLNKYNRASLKSTFTHIMLMDSVYKEDGNLTNMWY